MELPARFTQAWIERTLPQLDAGDIEAVLSALRAKNWTEQDLIERVYPFIPRAADPPGVDGGEVGDRGRATGSTREIDLHCPRGHKHRYSLAHGWSTVTCPACRDKLKYQSEFQAGVDLVCRGVKRNALWRDGIFSDSHIGTRYEIAYENPDPPPPQRLMHFTKSRSDDLHLKSGHRFSVSVGERGLLRAKSVVCWLVNHEIDRGWAESGLRT